MPLTQLLIIIALILFILFAMLLAKYNSFVKLRNRVKTNFSDISIQLKKRAALIQNLVELVKEYADHESKTFTQVAKARSAVDSSSSAQESAQAENMLSQTLRSLMVVSEDYPELKANDNYIQVKQDLLVAENDIVRARAIYNQSVENYNNAIQMVPGLLVANMFEFKEADLFQPTAVETQTK